jgi:hypothetical protein
LPDNSSVYTNTDNRMENVFLCGEQKHGAIGSLLPGNVTVNMHPQQYGTVFSVGSVQRNYLNDKRLYELVLSSKFSVEDSHGNFVDR